MNKKYKLPNGDVVEISLEGEAEFLANNEGAVLVPEGEDNPEEINQSQENQKKDENKKDDREITPVTIEPIKTKPFGQKEEEIKLPERVTRPDGSVEEITWEEMKAKGQRGWRKKKREFEKTQSKAYIKKHNMQWDEASGKWVHPDKKEESYQPGQLLVPETPAYNKAFRNKDIATIAYDENGEPLITYQSDAGFGNLDEIELISPISDPIPKKYRKWQEFEVPDQKDTNFESVDGMVDFWMNKINNDIANNKSIRYLNPSTQKWEDKYPYEGIQKLETRDDFWKFLSNKQYYDQPTGVTAIGVGEMIHTDMNHIEHHGAYTSHHDVGRRGYDQLEYLLDWKNHVNKLRSTDVEDTSNISDSEYMEKYYNRVYFGERGPDHKWVIDGDLETVGSYQLDNRHFTEGGLYYDHSDDLAFENQEMVEDLTSRLESRMSEFQAEVQPEIDAIFSELVEQYRPEIQEEYKKEIDKASKKFTKKSEKLFEKLEKEYLKTHKGYDEKEYNKEVIQKAQNHIQPLIKEFEERFHQKYPTARERGPLAQRLFNEELEAELGEEYQSAIKRFEKEYHDMYREKGTPVQTQDAYNTQVIEKYNSQLQGLSDSVYENVNSMMTEAINARVIESDEYNDFQNNVIAPKYEAWAENLWNGWAKDWSRDFEIWDRHVDDNNENTLTLDKIGESLNEKGFAEANYSDKRIMLEMELQEQLRRLEQSGLLQDGDVGTREKLIKDFYGHFYSKLNKVTVLGADGEEEEINKNSHFYLKGMTSEINDWLNENDASKLIKQSHKPPEIGDMGIPTILHEIKEINPLLENMLTNELSKYPELEEYVGGDYSKLLNLNPYSIKRKKGKHHHLDLQLYNKVTKPTVLEYQKSTKLMRKEVDKIMSSPEDKGDMGGSAFWSGFKSLHGYEYVPILSGVVNMKDSWHIQKIAKKPKEERNLLENNLIALHSIKNESDQMVSDISWNYNAGKQFAHSIPFIGEFIIGSPAYGAAFKATKLAATRVIANRLIQASTKVDKGGKLVFASQTARFAAGANNIKNAEGFGTLMGFVAGTNVQTIGFQGHNWSKNTAERMTDEMIWAVSLDPEAPELQAMRFDAITAADEEGRRLKLRKGEGWLEGGAKGYGITWAEQMTERLGYYMPGAGRRILNALPGKSKYGDVIANSHLWEKISLGHLARKYGLKNTEEVIAWSSKNAGWNGWIQENAEEWINMPVQNLITGDQKFLAGIRKYDMFGRDIGWDKENLYTTGLSVAGGSLLFGGGGLAINTVRGGSVAQSYFVNNKRFMDFKNAWSYLQTMKKRGKLNKDLDIEIRNDAVAEMKVGDFLVKNKLNRNQIKNSLIDRNGDIITADEVDVMNELNDEDRSKVLDIKEQSRQINEEIENLENSDISKKKIREKKKELKNKLNELNKKKASITSKVKDNIIKRKTEKVYQKILKNIRNINDQAGNRIKITEKENASDARNTYLEKKFGIREEIKNGISNFFFIKNNQQLSQQEADLVLQDIKENEHSHGYFVAGKDGQKSEMIINRIAAITHRGENVAGHEFFHFFLRRTLDKNPALAIAWGRTFERQLVNLDPRLFRDTSFRARYENYLKKPEAERYEEAMALFLDGIASGQIKYNEGFSGKVRDIIRHIGQRMGVTIKIDVNDTRSTMNFLRDLNRDIQRGDLSASMKKAMNEGIQFTGSIEELETEVAGELETESIQIEDVIKNFRKSKPNSKLTDEQLKEQITGIIASGFKFSKAEYDRNSNNFDKHITSDIKTNEDFNKSESALMGVYEELFTNKDLDGLLANIIFADPNWKNLPKSIQESIKEDIKFDVYRKMQNEYKPYLEDGGFRSLFSWMYGKAESKGLGGAIGYSILNIKDQYVKDPSRGAGSLEIQTPEGTVTRDVADVTSAETVSFEEQDLTPRVETKKTTTTPTTKSEIKGKLIENELEFSNETKQKISETAKESKYDIEGKTYKDVKSEVLSQVNPKANTKNQVDPTGAFYPIIESISQNEYGVNPKSVIAKRQNLTKPESESARTKIANDAKRMGPKKYVESILGQFAQTPKGEAVGINPTLLKDFYKQGPRVPNIKGHVLNVENMSNEEILSKFGINKDYTLQPWKKGFKDGSVKGIITQSSVLAANQEIRIAKIDEIKTNIPGIKTKDAQEMIDASEISIGKSDIMFSKAINTDNIDTYVGGVGTVLSAIQLGLVNSKDNKQVKELLKDVYGKSLSAKEIRETANEIVKWRNQWESIQDKKARLNKTQLKKLDISLSEEMNIPFEEYVIRNTEEAFLDKKVFDLLGDKIPGKYKNFMDIYNDKSRINTARAVVPSLAQDMLDNGVPTNVVIRTMLIYGQGLYSSTSKIHNGKWTIRNNKTGPNTVILNKNNPNGKGTARGQVFENVGDFLTSLSTVKDLGIEGLSRQDIIKRYNISTKVLADKSSAVFNSIEKKGEAVTFEISSKQAKEAQDFISTIGSHYMDKIKEGSLDYVDLAMLNKMFLSNMQTPLRKAAPVAYLGVGTENVNIKEMGKLLEYEHMVPASVKALEITESLVNTGKVDSDIFNDYTVAIIPKTMDDVLVSNSLRNFMPVGWKKGDPQWLRYYNAQTLGDKRLVPIRSINPKDKGKIVGQTHVNISQVFNNGVNIKNNNTLEATRMMHSMSINNKKRGMSTFDFDDTLAKTKSGVRVRLPNLDGKPKPKRKVVFLAGGAGSGKGNVVSKLGLEKQGFKIVNQDISLEWLKKNHGLPENMNDLTKEQRSTLGKLGHQARGIAKRKMMKYQGNAEGVVVDGTGASLKNMQNLVTEFEGKGYDVSMVFVETSLDVALTRNKARAERSLLDIIVRRNHESVMNNKQAFTDLFGDRFMEVNTDNMSQKDNMPTELTEKMNDFVSGYEKRRLDAEEFAEQGSKILEQGGKFDFSEFNKVVEGTPGPLLDKAKARAEKHGTKDIFILTARPQESAPAIQQFLKDQGLDIPIENITGLANSSGNAKAEWMLQKFAEGYNDMYFVDDAIQNVESVQEVLDQLDIKSDVVQAKIKFSKNGSKDFNDMLERVEPEIKSDQVISDVGAKMKSRQISLMKKLKLNIFIPPSAEDFKGLLYNFLGKGKQGEQDLQFFKDNLLTPYAKANRVINNTKQKMSNEYADLKKNAKDVKLREVVKGTEYTNDTAIRVYLWNKNEFEIPGLSQQEQSTLVDHVKNNPSLLAFAEGLGGISRMPSGYIAPSNNWFVENIAWDLNNIANIDLRNEFLQEWKENKDIIFSKENLNKIEAIYGSGFRESLENMLYRMEHGKNRLVGKDSVVNGVLDWINGSVGATMFWNTRSAMLQTISTVNFINYGDNNPLAVAKAFANQPQFWKDFSFIFNSDMLKQRRAGLQIDVSASELGNAFENGGRTPGAIIGYLLQQGFTPTRIADSFAIAFGGASFYRNRVSKYTKQGMSEIEAKEQAFLDFQEIAEETQQSSRPDLISQQQAGILGRIVLAWQNTPMQMTRLTKKAISDLANGRGSIKGNVSKILYYGAIQNLIFGTLQSGLAWAMWGDDEEEIKRKEIRVANGMLDTILRGTGMYGAALATLKNTILQWKAQSEKGYGKRQDWKITQEMVNISPPIGSKVRKIMSASKTEQFNKGVGDKLGLRVENPNLAIGANIIEATTNLPTGRVLNKANNLEEAFTANMKLWQRAALVAGWNMWDVGHKDEELVQAKKDVKADKKKAKDIKREIDKKIKDAIKEDKKKREEQEEKDRKEKEGIKTVQCSGIKSNGQRCSLTTETKKESWKCQYHRSYKPNEETDNDGDGVMEVQCSATTGSGKRCKNRTENKNKRCYAHQ